MGTLGWKNVGSVCNPFPSVVSQGSFWRFSYRLQNPTQHLNRQSIYLFTVLSSRQLCSLVNITSGASQTCFLSNKLLRFFNASDPSISRFSASSEDSRYILFPQLFYHSRPQVLLSESTSFNSSFLQTLIQNDTPLPLHLIVTFIIRSTLFRSRLFRSQLFDRNPFSHNSRLRTAQIRSHISPLKIRWSGGGV